VSRVGMLTTLPLRWSMWTCTRLKKRIHSPLSMKLSRYRRTIDGAHGPRYLCLLGGPWRPMAGAAARIV
jgi:hypothetical protein